LLVGLRNVDIFDIRVIIVLARDLDRDRMSRIYREEGWQCRRFLLSKALPLYGSLLSICKFGLQSLLVGLRNVDIFDIKRLAVIP
jgi:hypothetical protein